MSKVLVFVQCESGKVSSASLAAITAGHQLKQAWSGSEVVAVVVGNNADADAALTAKYDLSKVYCVNLPKELSHYSLAVASAVSEVANKIGAGVVVAASTSLGKEMLPAVAAALDAGMASDVISVSTGGNLLRPMYAGNAIAEVTLGGSIRCVSIRATTFTPIKVAETPAAIEAIAIDATSLPQSQLVEFHSSATGRPDLADAKIVVSGGRGTQSKEGFEKYIFPLADKLGAAIGASRAAVDAGFAPNDWQVGQTGKTVAPQLYIAVGISGAIQHLAGIKDAKVVVAINKDPDAPIFEVADFGLVADLQSAVPELIQKLS